MSAVVALKCCRALGGGRLSFVRGTEQAPNGNAEAGDGAGPDSCSLPAARLCPPDTQLRQELRAIPELLGQAVSH